VEGQNKEQKALVEKEVDKFITSNKKCYQEFLKKDKSINSDLKRKIDNHYNHLPKKRPTKSTTKSKED
jgi:hypothetical protein